MRDMSMTLGGTDVRFPDGVWPLGSPPDSLVRLAAARWPSTRAAELPVVAAFVVSAFSPLVAAVADLCLSDYFGAPPADPQRGERTAIVVASSTGDLGTAAAVASAVQGGKRVQPLLFYQSNHNAVAGYIGARWNLAGPVVCTMPGSLADVRRQAGALDLAAAEAAASAELLIEGGDADAALVIAANAYLDDTVEAVAGLIGPASWSPRSRNPKPAVLKGIR